MGKQILHLSKEQLQRLGENYMLVFSFLNRNNYNQDYFYDAAVEGLINATKHYDPNNNAKFSGFAFQAMQWKANHKYKQMQVQFSDRSKVLPHVIGNDEVLFAADIETAVDGDFSGPERDEIIIYINKTFSLRERTMLSMLMNGYNQTDIATRFDITRSRVQQIIAMIRTMINNEFKLNYLPPKAIVRKRSKCLQNNG